MFKEKGYDEFLAEKIRLGLEDVRAGRSIPLEVAKAQSKAKLEEKIREMTLDKQREELNYA